MSKFPHYHQPDQMDCGPTCLRIIAKYYGRAISLPKLRKLSETTREGSSLKTIAETAEKIGFRTLWRKKCKKFPSVHKKWTEGFYVWLIK